MVTYKLVDLDELGFRGWMSYTRLIIPGMDRVNLPLNQRYKSDGIFYHCFSNTARNYHTAVSFNIIKIVFFGIITYNIFTQNEYAGTSWMALCFIGILASSLFQLIFAKIILSTLFKDPWLYLSVAQKIGHVVTDEPVNMSYPQIHQCYSTNIYIAQSNMPESQVQTRTKLIYFAVTTNSMLYAIRNRHPLFKWSQLVLQLVNMATVVLSIIALSTQDMSIFRFILLVVYVVLVGLANIIAFLLLVLLCLLPILLIAFLFYYLCCRKKPEGEYIDLEPHLATQRDSLEAKGNCSICFQPLAIDQRVYILPCSPLHVFHCQCLDKWSVVKNTCPNCREPIPMTNRRPQAFSQ